MTPASSAMNNQDFEGWLRVFGASGVGAFLMALFGRWTMRKIAQEGEAATIAKSGADIVSLMRAEIERLHEINNRLETKLLALRQENGELRAEIAELRGIMESMRGQKP